jgi:hypothetical protein
MFLALRCPAYEEWQQASAAAVDECKSGRGSKCLDAETKRDRGWLILQNSRDDLIKAPTVHPDSGAKRAAALLPITKDQVRLYQPMLIPVGIAANAAPMAIVARAHEVHASSAAGEVASRCSRDRGNART